MKRLLVLLTFVALPLVLFAACGDEEDDGRPLELQQADRDRIAEMAATYVGALQQRDMAAAQTHLVDGVPSATVTKAMDTVRDEGFSFVAVKSIEPSHSDGATAQVTLNDADGREVTRELELRLEDGEWHVYSPHLKEP